MDEHVRKANEISTGVFRAAVQSYFKHRYPEDQGYVHKESILGDEDDTRYLTDFFILKEGKYVLRIQHKHTSYDCYRDYFLIRFQRTSGAATDVEKLLSLPEDKLSTLIFTSTAGELIREGCFKETSGLELKKWILRNKERIEENLTLVVLYDNATALAIPCKEIDYTIHSEDL